jgi:hypothetical protein
LKTNEKLVDVKNKDRMGKENSEENKKKATEIYKLKT